MKYIPTILAVLGAAIGTFLAAYIAANAATILFPSGGGTGTSTAPIYGQVLVGNVNGTYTLTATSSLGITGGGGSFPFTTSTTFGQSVYATSTPTLWFQTGLFASSTSHIDYASTTDVSYGTTADIFSSAGNLGLRANGSTANWSGGSFFPGTTNAKGLGTSANAWNTLFANFASTTAISSTGDVNFNTAGYPQDFFGPFDSSPIANVEINSLNQGNYASYGLKNNNGGGTFDASLVLDNQDTVGGIGHYLMLDNLTGSATGLQIQDGAVTILSDYNGLSGLLDTISPPYNAGGTEAGMTTTLQQSAGNDAVDYGLQNYPGAFATGIDAYQNYYSNLYAQPLPEPHFSFWEQQNGNTSEASTSWGFLGATTTVSGANATTTSVDVGDLGNTTQFLALMNPTNPTFNVISSSTKATAFQVSKNTAGALSTDFLVTNTGTASSTNVIDSSLTSGNCVQASTGGLLTTTGSACGSGGTTYTGTFPIAVSGSTISFGGLSTSTAAVQGNIPYFSGVNTFANVATSSLTGTGVISVSNSPSIIGSAGAVASLTGGSAGQYLVWLNGQPTWQATTTVSNGTGINCAFNAGANSESCSFANQSAHTVLTNQLNANGVPTGEATSTFGNTLYGVGADGTTLTESGGVPSWGTLTAAGGGTGATSLSSFFSTVSNVLTANEHHSFTYATSSWTGTTTIPLETGYGEAWQSIRCFTDAGTVGVDLYHASSHLNYIPTASTTNNVITFTTNNTMTAGDKVFADIGTPASSPTKISCTEADRY